MVSGLSLRKLVKKLMVTEMVEIEKNHMELCGFY